MEMLVMITDLYRLQSILCNTLNGQGKIVHATGSHPDLCEAVHGADFSCPDPENVQ